MGTIPLEELKRQWGQDMTSEQAIGYIIQHLEQFNALVKERGQTITSLVAVVNELKQQVSTLHDRVLLLEKQEGQRKAQSAKRGTQSTKRKT